MKLRKYLRSHVASKLFKKYQILHSTILHYTRNLAPNTANPSNPTVTKKLPPVASHLGPLTYGMHRWRMFVQFAHALHACTKNLSNMKSVVCKTINSQPKSPVEFKNNSTHVPGDYVKISYENQVFPSPTGYMLMCSGFPFVNFV